PSNAVAISHCRRAEPRSESPTPEKSLERSASHPSCARGCRHRQRPDAKHHFVVITPIGRPLSLCPVLHHDLGTHPPTLPSLHQQQVYLRPHCMFSPTPPLTRPSASFSST